MLTPSICCKTKSNRLERKDFTVLLREQTLWAISSHCVRTRVGQASFCLCRPSCSIGREGVNCSALTGGLVHLSSVHSWCHFITHILNISKHSLKSVCAWRWCVCYRGLVGGGNLTVRLFFFPAQQLIDTTPRCVLNVKLSERCFRRVPFVNRKLVRKCSCTDLLNI